MRPVDRRALRDDLLRGRGWEKPHNAVDRAKALVKGTHALVSVEAMAASLDEPDVLLDELGSTAGSEGSSHWSRECEVDLQEIACRVAWV